jgi:hypothetical protein
VLVRETTPSICRVSLDRHDWCSVRDDGKLVSRVLGVLTISSLSPDDLRCRLTKTSTHGIETTRVLIPFSESFWTASTQRGISEPVETMVMSASSASSRM